MPDLYQRSIEIILANQHASGAYVACPNFPSYRYCWFRDGSFVAYAMDLAGQHESAACFHAWAARAVNRRADVIRRSPGRVLRAESAEPNEFIPAQIDPTEMLRASNAVLRDSDVLHTRLTLEGEDGVEQEWTNFQLDGFGTWLWALEQHRRLTGQPLPEDWLAAAGLAAEYLSALWQHPCYDCWEEFGDKVHPHTLAAIYGGLKAYQEFTAEDAENAEQFKKVAVHRGDAENAEQFKKVAVHRGDAENAESFLNKEFSAPSASSAVNRILGEIKAYIEAHFVFNGHFVKFEGQPEVDASLLGLAVPYGVVAPGDPRMLATAAEIERTLRQGKGGVHRYAADTYYGGGEWPLLTAWLGWYYAVLNSAFETVGRSSLTAGSGAPETPSGKDARPTTFNDLSASSANFAQHPGRAAVKYAQKIAEILAWVEAQADANGDLPEQAPVAHLNDPAYFPHWLEKWGPVATPLLWSHAKYIILKTVGK